jgi:hypothetical protein
MVNIVKKVKKIIKKYLKLLKNIFLLNIKFNVLNKIHHFVLKHYSKINAGYIRSLEPVAHICVNYAIKMIKTRTQLLTQQFIRSSQAQAIYKRTKLN